MNQLLSQIRSQYTESRDFFYSRKLRQVRQLQLLNNLRRGDENIASTLLFSFFNRIMSGLYEDKIQSKFVPSEEMDYKRIEALNKLAINDFREMDMAQKQYDWVWDTLFFSKGYIETLKFDKKRKLMMPVVLNPLAFGSDPFFANSQDWRYYWKWILKPGHQLKKLIDSGVVDGVSSLSEIAKGMDADLWNFKVQREQAKVLTSTADSSLVNNLSNDVYQILEIYTTNESGEKILAWVDKSFSKILMTEKLKLNDDGEGGSNWPIVVKDLFREPHSSVSFSVPDIIEDKHRAESVLFNLAFIAAKDEANPIYKYNPNLVKDPTQLFQRQVAQHIPVDDINNAIAPMQTSPSLSASLLNFIMLLKSEASDPIGTGVSLTPLKKGKQTATETAIQQQLNDLTQSLQSKVLQIGEKDFWSHWYQRYVNNSKSGDEKIISITSVKGISFEKIDLGDIKTKYPPKVEVFSAKEAQYKELVEKRDMMQIYPQFVNSMDAAGLKNFNKFIFLPKFVKDSSSIDLIMPKSIDELNAEAENDLLDLDKMPNVKETDDHETHLYVHASAKNTPAKIAHSYWHEELRAIQKKQQAQAPPREMVGNLGLTQKQTNPLESAVPAEQVIGQPRQKVAIARNTK